MSSPLIGITTYEVNTFSRYSLPETYVNAVRRAGGIPILLPPGEIHLQTLAHRIDGFIFAGGGDIDPMRYGGKYVDEVGNISPVRDNTEITLARYLIRHQIPLLAIARGLQIVNVALGGTLIEHLPSAQDHRIMAKTPVRHTVHIDPTARLAEIVGQTELSVASMHHQAVDTLAPTLRAVAHAEDGIIEAVEMVDNPQVIAVQWHAHMTAEDDPIQLRLFERLIDLAQTRIPAPLG